MFNNGYGGFDEVDPGMGPLIISVFERAVSDNTDLQGKGNESPDAGPVSNTETDMGDNQNEGGDPDPQGGNGNGKRKNSDVLYWGFNNGDDAGTIAFAYKIAPDDNSVVIFAHGNEGTISDYSGNSGKSEVKIHSSKHLDAYLYEYSNVYRSAVDNGKPIKVYIYACDSYRFAEGISRIQKNFVVMGLQGYGFFSENVAGSSTSPYSNNNRGYFNYYYRGKLQNQISSKEINR